MSENFNHTTDFLKGRGAQLNVKNRFEKQAYTYDNIEFLDEPWMNDTRTEYFTEYPKKIINKVESPDVGAMGSMNPYQGCEHGCIYCYARNSHQYWGFSAGMDFERKIMMKPKAPDLLRAAFDNPKYIPSSIMLAGNTDCYQPIERKMQITRKLLEVFLEYRHPVGIITKNALILRDTDILAELAALNLLHVSVSITSLNEDTRQKMEPRTTTAKQRLRVISELSKVGVPMNVMIAPIIPSITDHEIPAIMKAAGESGASSAGYTVVRLNGAIGEIFTDWVNKCYPDRAEKVLKQIAECHGGTLNDSRWGTRMKGEGNYAQVISRLFKISKAKYLAGREWPASDYSIFKRPEKG
jgi:DNA repair photolyase